jgi:adenylate kinase family enzyme
MPRLDPRVESQREVTIEIVERLMKSGEFMSEKHALVHLYTIATAKRAKTGFIMDTFAKFYERYRCWKRRHKSLLTPKHTSNFDDMSFMLE